MLGLIKPLWTAVHVHLKNNKLVSNSQDPDHAQYFVGPDLGINCLQSVSADDISRLRVKALLIQF